jgi:hypothetical protein
MEDWLDLWLKDPSTAEQGDVPSPDRILNLARDLVSRERSSFTWAGVR